MSRNQVNKTIETSRRTLRDGSAAGYGAAHEARHTIHQLTRVKAQGRIASAFDTVGDYINACGTRRMAHA